MALRNLSNNELIRLYDSELVLKLHNLKNLSDTRGMLSRFMANLGSYPPSPEMAKSFLAQYANRKPRTLYRYTQMLRGFMKWYGQPIDDVKIKVSKTLPPYTENSVIEKFIAAIANKQTHKGSIVRDILLVELDRKTGMRRGELANLEPREIHDGFLVVRDGKNHRDRMIPLPPSIETRLHNFIAGMAPDEKVFKLKAPSISNKIRQFAKKAGLDGFHTHTLRHKFATDVLESGTNIKVLQTLMGHENLNTTEVYLSITDTALYAAAERLDEHHNKAVIGNVHKKSDSGSQSACAVPTNAASGNLDPWTEALRVARAAKKLKQCLLGRSIPGELIASPHHGPNILHFGIVGRFAP